MTYHGVMQKRSWVCLVAGLCCAFAACSSSDSAASLGSAKGLIAVDGKPRTARSCAIAGAGASQVLRLTLDDGSVLRLPVNEAAVYVSLDGKDQGTRIDCEKAVAGATGGDTFYKGSITRTCKSEELRVELSAVVDCKSLVAPAK